MQRSGPVEGTPAEAAVLTMVLTAGAIARADIARRTGLSSAAVTRAAQPLLDAGFLRYADDDGTSRPVEDATSHMG
ncbi:MAG: MarR family transcriptional regulator, partial [Micrococcales bacterium]|nr:MarR family transcriptional regulator [Micrococcales bacterium]